MLCGSKTKSGTQMTNKLPEDLIDNSTTTTVKELTRCGVSAGRNPLA